MSSFQPVAIAVCGSPAAGKTTIAVALSEALQLPLITRDELAAGLLLGASGSVHPDEVRGAAEKALIAASDTLAASDVSFVLESSVLDSSHLGPLVERGARVLVVHAVASSAVIRQRLRDRVGAGDDAMQRLLDQHESGLMQPEIFAPWNLADALVTVDTSAGLAVAEHTAAVIDALQELLASTAPR